MKDFQYYQIAIQRFFNSFVPGYPELFLRLDYFRRFRKPLHLVQPQSFNEKMQWLKLHGRYEEHASLVDKITAKEQVQRILGDDYTIKSLQVASNGREIDPDALPEKYVIKPNHLSGRVLISRERGSLSRETIVEHTDYWQCLEYYYVWFESTYKGIKPRIMVEELLDDGNDSVRDYKFYCFNGRVEYAHVDMDRFIRHTRVMFSREWQRLPFSFNFPLSDVDIPRPERLPQMIKIAETLSRGFPFVRIDLYDTAQGIKFGEYTFFPETGFGRFNPPEWDLTFGALFQLPAARQ